VLPVFFKNRFAFNKDDWASFFSNSLEPCTIQDILDFNLRALNNGHELSELPLIDDDTVDLTTFRLGPVTPTLAGVPGQPLFLPYPPETQENVANYSSFFGATGRCNALSSFYIMPL